MQIFKMSLDRAEEFILYAKQNDAGSRFFQLLLSSGGVVYEPPADATFTVHYGCGGMPAGSYSTIEAADGTTRAAVEQKESALVVELTPDVLSVAGENRLYLAITAGDYRLGTWDIRVLIQPVRCPELETTN